MTQEMEEPGAEQGRFRIVQNWQAMNEQDAADLSEFWQRHGALSGEELIRKRLSQVVVHARTPEGEIAGVSTVDFAVVPQLDQPMYLYRSFIAPPWRKTLLVRRLFTASASCLEEYARVHDYPAIGLIAVLENSRFGEIAGRDRPVWGSGAMRQWTYIGKNAKGREMRVSYFKGARLKRS